MKKLLPLLATVALTGCSSPLGALGRIFPDGSSGAIDEINMQASMTGSGSMVLKGVRWSGTNGFPLPATGSNVVGGITVAPAMTVLPSGTMLRVK